MWNIAFDNLLRKYDTGPVKIGGFADDAVLLISGIDPQTLADKMNKALETAQEWASESQLNFSAMKSQAILFHTKNKHPNLPQLYINSKPIPYVTETRYLGVKIDRKLNWVSHITEKCKEAKRRLMILRNKLGKMWGPKPKIMKWIWTGIIQPTITYACHVWIRLCSLKKVLALFNRLHSLTL
jgi:hypothetical protein